MKAFSTVYTSSASHTRLTSLLVIAAAAAAWALCTPSADARDLSLQYRNYPGFQCHGWNSAGECIDFSYFENAPYHGPSRYPTYAAPIKRPIVAPVYQPIKYPTNIYYSNTYRPGYNNVGNCGGYYDDCYGYGKASVRVTAAPNPAYVGDRLTYSLYVRNEGYARNVHIWADFDQDTDFVFASNNGEREGNRRVHWNLHMNDRQSRTLTLTVRVNPNARNSVRLNAHTDSSSDDVVTNINTRSYNYNQGYYNNGNCYYNDCYNNYNYNSNYYNYNTYDPYYRSSSSYSYPTQYQYQYQSQSPYYQTQYQYQSGRGTGCDRYGCY